MEPDLFYVTAETETRLVPNRRTTADLVVEVISPGSAIYDLNTKADTYAALDVRELWLVDEHNGTIEVRTLENERLLPGEVHSGSEEVQSTVLGWLQFCRNSNLWRLSVCGVQRWLTLFSFAACIEKHMTDYSDDDY